MGTIIRNASISRTGHTSSMECVVEAGLACIAGAGIDKDEIGLLINIGVYRDDNIVEPSIASLIQRGLELNLDPVKRGMINSTFSFDLLNGSCGFLDAVKVADAILQNGKIKYAMIVSGDMHRADNAVCTTLGGAAILSYDNTSDRGFRNIETVSSSDVDYYGYKFEGVLSEFDTEEGREGRFTFQDHYGAKLLSHSVAATTTYLNDEALVAEEIKYLISTEVDKEFSIRLGDSIGLNPNSYISKLYSKYGNTHTSALISGYVELMDNLNPPSGGDILFVSAGAGLAASCGLYLI